MTSLGNWVKQYSWSSYQKKAQEKKVFFPLSSFLLSKNALSASGVWWRSHSFCPNKRVEFSLSQHHTWRARPWTGLSVQQTSKAAGLASKPWDDEKSPKPKYEGCFFLFVLFFLCCSCAFWKTSAAFASNTEAALFNWNLTFWNQRYSTTLECIFQHYKVTI